MVWNTLTGGVVQTAVRRKRYTKDELKSIYSRCKGACDICDQPIVFQAYGRLDHPGGWQVDHSKAIARGGTNHPNNLVASHIRCNLKKGSRPRAEARSEFRQERAKRHQHLFGVTMLAGGMILGILKLIRGRL